MACLLIGCLLLVHRLNYRPLSMTKPIPLSSFMEHTPSIKDIRQVPEHAKRIVSSAPYADAKESLCHNQQPLVQSVEQLQYSNRHYK